VQETGNKDQIYLLLYPHYIQYFKTKKKGIGNGGFCPGLYHRLAGLLTFQLTVILPLENVSLSRDYDIRARA
jgi:hypothetical protein